LLNRLLIRTAVVIGRMNERGKVILSHRQDPGISGYFILGLEISLLVYTELTCHSIRYSSMKFILVHM